MLAYNRHMYIYPPRAEEKIPPEWLHMWEKRGWWAQIKKNGTNHVIFISPEKKITSMGRHENLLKDWKWTPKKAERFLSLPGKGWYVINAEVMYKKHLSRGVNYIHDILVNDGQYLLGTTYAQRYAMLQSLFLHDSQGSTLSHHILNEHTWLARNIRKDFQKVFDGLTEWEDEGLVLKDPNGQLGMGKIAKWTVKCRKQTENIDH